MLDDATARVDATTEREIKRALREVMEGRTTFVIAHRLSTIALADRIVVLEGGRDRRARHARGAAGRAASCTREIVDKGLPDQAFLSARRRRAREAGCERRERRAHAAATTCAAPLARDRRRAAASCAACWSCCAPTAARDRR